MAQPQAETACERCRDVIPLFVLAEGDIDAPWVPEMKDHLAGCDECATFYDERFALAIERGEIRAPQMPQTVRDRMSELEAEWADRSRDTVEPMTGAATQIIQALRLVWALGNPVLRPIIEPTPAMAADQLVEARGTPDGALQISLEVKLPDEGLPEGGDVPIIIHALSDADRPELASMSLSCRLREGDRTAWEGVLELEDHRARLATMVPRPAEQRYRIEVEPLSVDDPS